LAAFSGFGGGAVGHFDGEAGNGFFSDCLSNLLGLAKCEKADKTAK